MPIELIKWDIYEIQTKKTPITEVMLRGRIRKFFLEKNRNALVENAKDIEKAVRFAIPSGENATEIKKYLTEIIPDASVEMVKESIPNPVLSKLKVNIEDRYTL